ncbi:hypothetical protein [Halodesulfovibrio marinisediminis]|uniref:Uncharacterized protein n=1 Tax=Halodesulfovibrio marinisediminis DSM 17456 TaxID=1121457 RepID=A0A1N6DU00_9BACT|nr:hypothetical protein [Halodesulfovibrio marinisediminis]SIN74183.1 hypothetical protein SAMN02745161_0479 [Halodesulfovibrio marinisediminis DSM 17456]
MHYTSITMNSSSTPKNALLTLFAIAICVIVLTPSISAAKKHHIEHRQDRVIGTDSSEIIIKEDYLSGDRIIRVKPKKQKEEDCNKYTSGQYPVIIKLEPDISNYKK